MQLELILDHFYVFFLVWRWKFKISQEYEGWIGHETSASDLNRKHGGYPAISDTLFLQIVVFFLVTLMNQVEIFYKSKR